MLNSPKLPKRFWQRTNLEPSSGCWVWSGARHGEGYGSFYWQGSMRLAHRVAYTALVGPIPSGLELDHLCRNRLCCNPAHLEPVTRGENMRRSPLCGQAKRNKTHCLKNHPLSGDNLYVAPNGQRQCITCKY